MLIYHLFIFFVKFCIVFWLNFDYFLLSFLWDPVWSCCSRLLYLCLLLTHFLLAFLLVAKTSWELFCQLHKLALVLSIWHHFLPRLAVLILGVVYVVLGIVIYCNLLLLFVGLVVVFHLLCSSCLLYLQNVAVFCILFKELLCFFAFVMCCISCLITMSIFSVFFLHFPISLSELGVFASLPDYNYLWMWFLFW